MPNNIDFFQNLFNTIPLIILIVNSEGRIVEINDRAKKFLNEHGELTQYKDRCGGEVLRCVYRNKNSVVSCISGPQCSRCILRGSILDAVKGSSNIQIKAKLTIESKGAIKTLDLLISTSPVNNADQRYAIIIIEDVTEKAALEEEVFKTQKLESIGILAGGIAHDFNNYLAALMSNIQLAGYRLEQGVDIQSILKKAEDVIIQATGLTQQLLALSKGGAPVKKVISLKDVLVETSKFVLRGKKVSSVVNIPDDLWLVEIDNNQIAQVVTNLLINAYQAMPEGVITIECENISRNFSNLPLGKGKYIKISVKDQGCGISPENLSKIFDPFYTTKDEGTGLGLTVCYSIIRSHGGYIGVESTPGIGTTVYFFLPAINYSFSAKALKDPEDKLGQTEHGKILLMDDEIEIAIPLSEMLGEMGYEVIIAREGTEAIAKYIKAENEGKPYDAVILDLTIPGGMGGEQTIEQLIKINPAIKAIVSSGYSNNPIFSDPLRSHFQGVVMKPYRIEELRRVLRQILNQSNDQEDSLVL